MSGLDEREKAIRQRLKDDFPHYAEKCLSIRPKKGGLIPFTLNEVQNKIHRRVEEQRAKTGRVRALILKARQPGCSTYVEGRYYWRVTHRKGVRAFILTHKADATSNLFGMVERFHNNCPAIVRPHVGKANVRELHFDVLDSGYKVGTAGAEGVGRSDTIQYFHGSEVAWWENADDHATGALQAVPDADDTEIILESTANGLGGLFYSMCKVAEKGESEYQLIFIPWFDHSEYRTAPPDDWQPPPEFIEYRDLYDLSADRLYWAYAKNRTLAQSIREDPDLICWKFRQEYPANAEEAFQTGSAKSFIRSEIVMRARKNTVAPDAGLPILLGVDPARGGRAKTRIIDRQGRRLGGHVDETIESDDTMYVATAIARIIDKVHPRKVNIDVGGIGAGVYDRLKQMGYGDVVEPVNFGGAANDEDKYRNKRAEIWAELRDWLADTAGADIPDDDALHTEMCGPVWGPGATREDANQRLLIEDKEHAVARVGSTLDGADAAALTFATHVRSQWEEDRSTRLIEEHYRKAGNQYA